MKEGLRYGRFVIGSLIVVLCFSFMGCAVNFKKTPPEEVRQAKLWKKQAEHLDYEMERLKTEKEREIERLREIKASLEHQLREEMERKDVKIGMDERGLVITLLDRVLFDSGKAKLKTESYEVLNKVSKILKVSVRDKDIGIEGHTDNQPIKYSGWKSNWELSTARALSVLHYFENEQGVDPARMSAIGYGPYKPVATNETAEGREKNRRVEIIILPNLAKEGEKYLQESESYQGIK